MRLPHPPAGDPYPLVYGNASLFNGFPKVPGDDPAVARQVAQAGFGK
jgi:hypothetical protein